MLVLTRSEGESVMIGSEIVVSVLEIRGDVVRIGIAAPKSVKVHREEVYRALEEANREAAAGGDAAAEAELSRRLAKPPADG
ncbi:MAG: carbon storage regulator CsrA [Sporichthyaceae bacterium]